MTVYGCSSHPQGDQGLPGELGSTGERGAGEPGAKVSPPPMETQCVVCPRCGVTFGYVVNAM